VVQKLAEIEKRPQSLDEDIRALSDAISPIDGTA